MNNIQQLALIGPTASGKTALSIKVAQKLNAHILSLDSLSIYKEIDIVSAKPSIEERAGIMHFGIDHIYPNEEFDVITFVNLYHDVFARCQQEHKNLVIVGGTSFYLKMLIEGISDMPSISEKTKKVANAHMKDLPETYKWLYSLDPDYMTHIASNDTYRIEKALQLYLESTLIPTVYFRKFPPEPTITQPIPIYQIVVEREILRERIALRTKLMLQEGLIDEIAMLEKKYSRLPNSMKAIGIKETLAYLDGQYSKKMLEEKIITNTARLAKRQTTFNNSQFKEVIKGTVKELEKILLK